MNRFIGLTLLIFLVSACSSTRVHYYNKSERDWQNGQPDTDAKLLYSVYAIGDAGGDPSNSAPIMAGLKTRLGTHNGNAGVVFLGDNIYPEGLHKKGNDLREQDEQRLNNQLEAIKDFEGNIVFIPGNHDWDRQGEKGAKAIKRQEKYVQEYLDRGNTFRPSHGCPGPDVVKLAPGIVMIIIDTQWWIHKYDRPSGEKDGCDVRNTDELMVLFRDALKKYRDQHIIVAAHHPLYSNGNHGGHFRPKDHLFPLTAKFHKMYIPMPVIGSIYPSYRKYIGHPQDIPHPVYQDMKRKLLQAMNEYDNVIYMAGHEHSLQYKQVDNLHHIVSGAGNKATYLKLGSNLDFGSRERGFSKISYYDNGEVWMDFFTYDLDTKKETHAFRKLLFTKKVTTNSSTPKVQKVSYKNKYASVTPDSTYAAGSFKRLFMGDLNRDVWTTAIEVPYLDIHHEKGGLTPIKKGGGMQTISLRMQGADGKQYTLRGIKKNATFLTARNLRGTLAQDMIYDGIAGSHPYASIVIPKLSDAAGVYHSNPKLVYVPKDSVLGDYLDEFGGMLCLFEERPDGDMSEDESFGSSKNVINYSDAIHNMHKNYHHRVDVDYTVNARLFDILIGDWDRHDDQWRWATFKQDGLTLYRPIPRDRDQAFFEFDGILMSITNRKWMVRKFQPFAPEIRDMAGQNFNARYFDRSFLIEASREDWIRIATNLQIKLTDQVIEDAIKGFPKEAYNLTGEEIISTLKERRNRLVDFAEEYYEILAKEVSIPGTLDDDYFEVVRHKNGDVAVSIFRRKNGKKKGDPYYHRIFHSKETKEIRLYGLDGKDEYDVEGEVKNSITVRIIGGESEDYYKDKSLVNGLSKHTHIYETGSSNNYKTGTETMVHYLPEEKAMDYDRKDFVYDKLAPAASIGFNPIDGFYIGPGFTYVKHGFKKRPYKFRHKLLANRTFRANGYNLYYEYDYTNVIGKAHLAGKFQINNPLVFQYFGTTNDERQLSTVRMNDILFMPAIKFASRNHAQMLDLSLDMQRINIESSDVFEVEDWELEEQNYLGITAYYQFSNRDNELSPSRGARFETKTSYRSSITTQNVNFLKFYNQLSLYWPINLFTKQTTVAFRAGFETNIGDYAFYQASFLNGLQNFRGIPRNRFSGRTASFQNLEIRQSLFKVNNYVAPFDVGILAHGDAARVWIDGNQSRNWHSSAGAGVFFTILDSFMLVATYSSSDDGDFFSIGNTFYF